MSQTSVPSFQYSGSCVLPGRSLLVADLARCESKDRDTAANAVCCLLACDRVAKESRLSRVRAIELAWPVATATSLATSSALSVTCGRPDGP